MLTFDLESLRFLVELVGSDRVVVGTDNAFGPQQFFEWPNAIVEALNLPAADQDRILRGNEENYFVFRQDFSGCQTDRLRPQKSSKFERNNLITSLRISLWEIGRPSSTTRVYACARMGTNARRVSPHFEIRCSNTRASECCGMNDVPNISRRSLVISSTMDG